MSQRIRAHLYIFLLIGVVYLFRSQNDSPGTIFRRQVRSLSQNIAEKICDGIDPKKGFTNAELERSASFRQSLNALRGGNPLKDFINADKVSSQLKDDYFMPLIPFAITWFVFLGIGFIGYAWCVTNWCCMYLICKNKCQKCKICKEPKRDKCKNLFLIGTLFFSVSTIAAALTGVVLSSDVSAGAKHTSCSLANLLQELSDGNPTEKWIGIKPSIDKVDEVINKFDQIVNNLPTIPTDFTQINSTSQVVIDKIQLLFEEGQGKSVQRPDPSIQGQYEPAYIQNLGPPANPASETGKLNIEVNNKNVTIQQAATNLSQAITALTSDQSALRGTLSTGKSLSQSITTQIISMLGSVEDFSKNISKISDGIGLGLLSVFVVNLTVALICFGSILFVCLCKFSFFNKFLHTGWCLMGLFMIFSWGLSLILFPGSLVIMESCDVLDTFLKDPIFFNKTLNALGRSDKAAQETLYGCIHGDGNILARLNIDKSIGHFSTIFEALNRTSDYYGQDLAKVPASIEFPKQRESLKNYVSGVYPDSKEAEDDLKELVTHTIDTDQNCVTGIQDTWKLNSLNCSLGSITYKTGDPDIVSRGSPICIGFNTWISNGGNIKNRYTSSQYPASCSHGKEIQQSYEQYITDFIIRFETNRNDITTLFQRLINKMNDAQVANDAFVVEVNKIVKDFYSLNDTVSSIQQVLVDSQSGLVENSNCTSVKKNMQYFSDAMCVGFIASMYQTAICMIVVSFFTMFGSLFGFCLAKRFVIKVPGNGAMDDNDQSMEQNTLLNGKKKTRVGNIKSYKSIKKNGNGK